MKLTFSTRQRKHPPPKRALLRRFSEDVMGMCGLSAPANAEISVSFVGPSAISRMNRKFLNHSGPTDVMAFNYFKDGGLSDGDTAAEVIICPDMAESSSRRIAGTSYSGEMSLYLIHGFLHIAGFDDTTSAERKKMRRAERRILAAMKRKYRFSDIFPPQMKA